MASESGVDSRDKITRIGVDSLETDACCASGDNSFLTCWLNPGCSLRLLSDGGLGGGGGFFPACFRFGGVGLAVPGCEDSPLLLMSVWDLVFCIGSPSLADVEGGETESPEFLGRDDALASRASFTFS